MSLETLSLLDRRNLHVMNIQALKLKSLKTLKSLNLRIMKHFFQSFFFTVNNK